MTIYRKFTSDGFVANEEVGSVPVTETVMPVFGSRYLDSCSGG
jgi:hypothetical protein